ALQRLRAADDGVHGVNRHIELVEGNLHGVSLGLDLPGIGIVRTDLSDRAAHAVEHLLGRVILGVLDAQQVREDAQRAPAGPRVSDRIRGRVEALPRSEEHTSELQSRENLVCRLLLEKKKTIYTHIL